MNYKIKEILRFLVMFPMMILSCGVSGAFLLRFQLNPLYFSVLIPLLFASCVSCRGFYDFVLSMERANSQVEAHGEYIEHRILR